MYIPEFVCGIGATILVEIALLIVCVIYDSRKKKKNQNAPSGDDSTEQGK